MPLQIDYLNLCFPVSLSHRKLGALARHLKTAGDHDATAD
jgi:hypothetical protein